MIDPRRYDSPEAVEAAERAADRYRRRPRADRPTGTPHLIAFDDGCASWLTYPNRDHAESALDDVAARNPELFAGATVVPFRRSGNRKLDPSTGHELPTYAVCPTHREGTMTVWSRDTDPEPGR